MVSELEKQRQENIERNQKLLREFQLKEAANLAFGDRTGPQSKATGTTLGARKRKKRFDTPEVPRRVRRLRKHDISDTDREALNAAERAIDSSGDNFRVQPDPQSYPQETKRKEGELQLQDLIGQGDWSQALSVMQSFGGKLSQADLFTPETKISDEKLNDVRNELSNQLVADNRDIKVVPERVASICFHPGTDKPVIIAGDKVGGVGVWDTSRENDEGLVNFNYHTGGVATIAVDTNNMARVYTGSYDGSIRMLDLQAQTSTEALVFEPDLDAGISDFALVDPNLVYYSTLKGQFGVHDLREKPEAKNPLRLSTKKIGGFSVNPLNTHQVATASLDRTLKIWDLRKPYQITPEEGEEDSFEEMGAFLCGVYNSRLSISASSWNTSGQIVCNGYDNTINVFDLKDQNYGDAGNIILEPSYRLQHNCQTGRWVSILKARWQEQPRDGIQKFVIGNMTRYADVFSGTGQQLAHINADHMTAVPAVSQFHRSENWICGGNASGKVYLWMPSQEGDENASVKGELDALIKSEIDREIKDETD